MKLPTGFVSLLLALGLIWMTAATPATTTALAAGGGLDAEREKGEKLVQTLRIQDALGPLAPIALSPFFALTCMSGASMLAESGLLPSAITNNALLSKDSALNNGFVFAGLLALTVITALPKLTKVTKPLAQAVDQIEGYSGIIAVVAVQFLSQMQFGGAGDAEKVAVVYQAGVFSFGFTTLLAAFSAINIFVVNTVKFFFEVLTFLSPFPFVDAAFEAANKAFAAFLVGLYVAYPWAAMLLNFLIFALALIVFAWAHRRVVYMRSVLGDPILGWLGERLLKRPKMTVVSTPLSRRTRALCPDATLVLKAFAGRGYLGVSRKARGYLVQSGGRLRFVALRFLRAPLVADLPSAGHRVRIDPGLLSNTVLFENDAGDVAMRIVFTRRYNDLLDEVRALVGEVVEEHAIVPGRLSGVVKDSRAVGAAMKSGGRDSLRAELA